jgi:3-oxoadipate enol-lactonase
MNTSQIFNREKRVKQCQSDRISWFEAGSENAPAIIFLHAMAGSGTAWAPQMRALSKSHRCIAWDMPGFGGSADLTDAAGMDEMVAALANFVTADLGLHQADFVGLSVGGMILQHFAYAHPDLARSISILDSSPRFGHGGDMKPAEFVEPVLAQLKEATVEAFSDGMVRAITGASVSEAADQEAITAMCRARPSGLALAANLIGAHDALDKLSAITCPTLVMAGAEDGETPPAYTYEIATRIPGAQVTIVPNAGHIVNLENPDAVNARLAFFLEHQL